MNIEMPRLSRSEQPWSGSVLRQVVAARDRAWGEYHRGVTRSQKYRAIREYFIEADGYEVRWPEAREVFKVYKEQLRDFLEDPMYGGGREARTVEEYGARFMLAWGGPEWEEEFDEEDSVAVADLVPSAEAVIVPAVEVDDSVEAPEAGVGAEAGAAGVEADLMPSAEADVTPSVEGDDAFGPNQASGVAEAGAAGVSSSVGSTLGRPPFGVIMVEPSVEELRRWEGAWRPVAFARRGGHGSGV